MPNDDGALHSISEAIGALRGEMRANERNSASYRTEMLAKLSGVEVAVTAMAVVSANMEEMRKDYHQRFSDIHVALGKDEHALYLMSNRLTKIETQNRINAVWLAGTGTLVGSIFTVLVQWLIGRSQH